MKTFTSRTSDQPPVPSEMGFEELYTQTAPGTSMYITVALHQHRIRILALVIGIITMGLLVRLGFLQIVRGSYFRTLADQNRIRSTIHFARRGIITDRFGAALVQNTPSFILTALPPQLPPSGAERAALIDALSNTFGIEPDEFQLINSPVISTMREVSLGIVLDYQQAFQFELNKERFAGIDLQVFANRSYPTSLLSINHILGYVGPTSPEDRKRNPNLQALSFTGKSGIELEYDQRLRGTDGATLWEYDSLGARQRIVSEVPSNDGQPLKTSISLPLQTWAQQAMGVELRRSGTTSGSVVVMNAQTGEILSLISLPSYDPEVFSSPRRSQERKNLLTNASKPLFFRAIAGQYPSGSTIKPFVATTALQNNIINRSTGVESTGGIRIGEFFFPDWKAGGHGWTTVTKALAQSVNTFFYLIVGGDVRNPSSWKHEALGMERFQEGLRQFGWGSPTRIDLPGEATGFVPSPQRKLDTAGVRWYIGDTYHVAIGQGDILVTPLQLATATARLASNNKNLQPWVVQSPNVSPAPIASDTVIGIVKEGMRLAVTDGSARRLNAVPLKISAKTGTAQPNSTDTPHSWLTSFANIGTVPVVVTTIIEHGGDGSGTALSVAYSIYQLLSQKPELVQ